MNEALQTTLKKLRLSGLASSLDVRLQEATGNGLNHTEFLELVLQDELAVRAERLMNRRVKVAAFREPKTLEDFDFAFNPSMKKKQIFDLATCRFIREARDVLLLGPPGTGKSHLVQALGYQAIKSGHTVLYRSIFDVVRDFLHDEAARRRGEGAQSVPEAGPGHRGRHGHEAVAQALGRVPVRDHHAAARGAFDGDDEQPAAGGLGQVARRRAQRHSHPRPLPPARRDHHHHRQELPAAKQTGRQKDHRKSPQRRSGLQDCGEMKYRKPTTTGRF
jgi:hypothetical protein